MTETQDRRTPGVNRVQVARLVDICGRDPSVPAFEAESVELSGRGMHVRTPYLPPLGAPLVCRLEDDGREIVVEGVVAWQKDHEGGGEFGVRFTALDSGSVEVLKELCGLEPRVTIPRPSAKTAPEEKANTAQPSGTPVKLHIDGLGAPMKARVKGGTVRKLQVGSNLEFLKVGRGLEVEDVEHGERRGARIDAVSIAIDPETQVPQLVVMLRYQGEDTTPEPSVVDGSMAVAPNSDEESPLEAAAVSSAPVTSDVSGSDDTDDDQDDDADAAAMRGRMDAFAVNVGHAAKKASDRLAEVSGKAATGMAGFLKDKGGKLGEAIARRAQSDKKRRTTTAAPATEPAGSRRLRPQNVASEPETAPMPKKKKLMIGAGVAAVLMIAGLATALGGHGKPTASTAPAPDSVSATLPPLNAAPAAQAPAMPMNGAANAAAAPAALNAVPPVPAVPGVRPGVVANVPLFGPTPMATLEPAPLGPAPDQIAPVAASAVTPAPMEERMDEDEKGSDDESFGDSKKDKDKKSPDAVADAVKPFSNGKMHLPLVHKLKLDKPGAALEGHVGPAGFSVIIPGRKVEGGGAIVKRDDRISEVKTKNGAGGAQITFVFRSKVPGYKVRLKKNYVEFFISSPDSAK